MGAWMLTPAQGCAGAECRPHLGPGQGGGPWATVRSVFPVSGWHCPLAWVLQQPQLESGHSGVGTGSAASLLLGSALGVCQASLHVATHQLSLGTLFPVQGFGRADHAVTTEKLRAEYPDYEITWADEGY